MHGLRARARPRAHAKQSLHSAEAVEWADQGAMSVSSEAVHSRPDPGPLH